MKVFRCSEFSFSRGEEEFNEKTTSLLHFVGPPLGGITEPPSFERPSNFFAPRA